MFQETVDIPIAGELGLYSAYKCAMGGIPDPWDPQAKEKEPEPEDDVKVRVDYLDSGYTDDHFDLEKPEHLLGKTLAKFTAGKDTVAKRSLNALGWCLFEKWDKLRTALDGAKDGLAKECVEKIVEIVSANEQCESKEELLKALESVKSQDVDIESELKADVEASVAQHEKSYIERQTGLYKVWAAEREEEIDRQFQLFQLDARREAVARKKSEMEEKEERLFFFEKKEELLAKKQEKEEKWRKSFPRRSWTGPITLKPKEKVKDDYVPPTF